MELKEVSASSVSPYRCYVKGHIIQTEGENVHTIGFKDGIAVVQVIPPKTTSESDMQRIQDNTVDAKPIDLTKLKKIIVKVDPDTGKKYILKDGRRIEILPQVNNPLSNIKKFETVKIKPAAGNNQIFPGPPPLAALTTDDSITRNIIIKKTPNLVLNGAPLPKISNEKVFVNKPNASLKIIDNVKYHVVSLNVKKPPPVVKRESMDNADKALQTENWFFTQDSSTQTDNFYMEEREPPITDQFLTYLLSEGDIHQSSRKMIEVSRPRTKEELNKLNFYQDMRKALMFDSSGNLPIHESVMLNDVRAVQKNCIILTAIRENVNIVNQQGYAPLHLAVLHDVDIEIVKILLRHGADLSKTDSEGNTAIHLAIESNHSPLLKVLIGGATNSNFNFDVCNHEGFTPLILACLNRSYQNAKLLLQHGADPNVKDMKSGRTALFHAAECYNVDLVELLIQNKADTKIRNFFGTSAHDAMFELEDMPLKIKFCILGREHQRFQTKKKVEGRNESGVKRAKLETTPILKRVTSSDVMKSKRK